MKFKVSIVSLLLFFFVIPITFVQAESDISTETVTNIKTSIPKTTKTPKGEALREEIKASAEAKRQEMIANREEKRLEMTEVRKERITSRFRQMQIRIEALIERVQKLIDKIDARIGKIDALETTNKIDTTDAKESLKLANSKLAEIRLLVDNLSIDETLSSDTPRETFTGVSEDVKIIKDGLKEVRALLIKTIGDLRGLRVGETNEE